MTDADAGPGQLPDERRAGPSAAPTTAAGRWSMGLMIAFAVMYAINALVFMPSIAVIPMRETILPFYGIAMLACGLAAGVLAVIALVKRDRSWVLWLPVAAGALVLFLLLGEFLVPH